MYNRIYLQSGFMVLGANRHIVLKWKNQCCLEGAPFIIVLTTDFIMGSGRYLIN